MAGAYDGFGLARQHAGRGSYDYCCVQFSVDCAVLMQLQRLAWNKWCSRVDERQEAAMRPLSVKARAYFVLVL